jgi:hypothetical protein
MLHPNHQATRYVWEVLKETMIDTAHRKTMDEVDEIVRAANHKPRNPHSEAHKQFISKYKEKILNLQERFPAMNFQSELHTLQSI